MVHGGSAVTKWIAIHRNPSHAASTARCRISTEMGVQVLRFLVRAHCVAIMYLLTPYLFLSLTFSF